MDIAITGSSGIVGTALVREAESRGHRVVRVVRSSPGPDEIGWSPADGTIDAAGFEGIDAVVHLAGAGIGAQRWTEEYKQAIRDSRVDGTSLLARTLAGLQDPPSVLVSQSASGYYGDRGEDVLTEDEPAGQGFLAEVVAEWETAADPAREAGIRVVHPRSGQVLSPVDDYGLTNIFFGEGSLQRLVPIARLGLAGRFGNGQQWWSWISLPEQVNATLFAIGRDDLEGPVNFVAPEPIRNDAFVKTLASVLGKGTFLPIPAFGPKLVVGADLAETLVFESQRVVPTKLQAAGYEFLHPDLETALRAVLDEAA